MAVTPLKVFLFLFGCTAAAGAVAYGTGSLDPLLGNGGGSAAAVAALPEPAPADPAAPKGERVGEAAEEPPPNTMMAAAPPADEAAPPADAAPPPAADQAATPPAEAAVQPPTMAAEPPVEAAVTPPADATPPAGPQPPTFDLVRVEAHGSLVVAGKAFADAVVELLNGDKVLGTDRATPEGDFAIVLDERLKPGDYQLTLRATPAGGVAVASLQTAVLSIPDQPGGQVLAMVEQPGEASNILTVPQPETPPADTVKPAEVAAAPAVEQPPAQTPKTEEAAAPPAGEQKPAEVGAAAAETPPATPPKTGEVTALPETDKPADLASAPAQSEPPPSETLPGNEAAAPPPGTDPAKPAETEPAPVGARVAVEAVEIDGGKVFVAGVGEPGRVVRVYANEIVLGETRVGEGGRFLIETERDLPVGEYVIRADLLDADGVKVIARATVPFEREPGEAIAAVAPAVEPPADEKPAEITAAEPAPPAMPADPGKPDDAAEAEQATPPSSAELPPATAEAGEQPGAAAAAVETPPADAAAPPAVNTPPAEEAAEVAQTEPPADTSPQLEQPAVVASEPAPAEQPAGTVQAEAPADAPPADGSVAAPPTDVAAAEQPPATTKPAAAAPELAVSTEEPPAVEQPAKHADVAPPPAGGVEIADIPPPETVSPKLQKVNGAVIIRRSDTLWRISRRVYGRGIRYWTIYLANQNQIADPDRIWPGQVFTVPEKSQEGEAADMSAMGSQVTTVTQQ